MRWWLPLLYLLMLAAAYLLGRTTASRPDVEIKTDTVFVEKIVQPPPSPVVRPAPLQVRIEKPEKPVRTDSLRIRAPVGVRWQGLIAPRPLHFQPGRVVLTYWHFPSASWRQEIYRTVPPRQKPLSAYLLLQRHWFADQKVWAAGVGLELRRNRLRIAVEVTTIGLTIALRLRVWPK